VRRFTKFFNHMDEDVKVLLKRNLELTEANHKLLIGMRRSARWASFFRLLYWFVILGGIALSYYFIQPYINAVIGAYDNIQGSISQNEESANSGIPGIGDLLQVLKR